MTRGEQLRLPDFVRIAEALAGSPRHRRMSVTVRAPAKVNLALVVGRPREDGFHPLNTVYQAISLYDDVRSSPSRRDGSCGSSRSGRSTSPAYPSTRPTSRSVPAGRSPRTTASTWPRTSRSARASRSRVASPAAAPTPPRRWSRSTGCGTCAPPTTTCSRSRPALGSDVPFALIGGTAQGVGRGELVTSLPDRGSYWWVVVPSDEGLSTPAVYREFDRLHPDVARGAHVRDPRGRASAPEGRAMPTRWPASMRNDLEEAAISLRPELAERIELVQAHRSSTVMLSGSGPTILGIAETQEARARDARPSCSRPGCPSCTSPPARSPAPTSWSTRNGATCSTWRRSPSPTACASCSTR